MGASVNINEGTNYISNKDIIPDWAGKWKVNRDNAILFNKDITFNWIKNDSWFYLNMEV